MHVILLTMFLSTTLFCYKEKVVSLFTKYFKCSIYGSVSNLTVLNFPKVMGQNLLGCSKVWGHHGNIWVETKPLTFLKTLHAESYFKFFLRKYEKENKHGFLYKIPQNIRTLKIKWGTKRSNEVEWA